jgi:hypothetical protein
MISLLAVASTAALAVYTVWKVPTSFGFDDWDPLATRTLGSASDWLRPHFDHPTIVITVIYRVLFHFFGLVSLPFQLVAIVLHVAACLLMAVLLRRSGVRDAIVLAATVALLFLGTAYQNITYAFGMSYGGALAFGFLAVVLLDHDGPYDRRNVLALVAGLTALGCSNVGITTTVFATIVLLLRRRFRDALAHTGPLGALYVMWWVTQPHSNTGFAGVDAIGRFLRAHGWSTLRAIGQLPITPFVVGALGLGGLWVAGRQSRSPAPAAAPDPSDPRTLDGVVAVAAAASAVFFAVSTAATRVLSPAWQVVWPASRYTGVLVFLLMPTIALGGEWLARRSRVAGVLVVALLVASVPGNLRSLRDTGRSAAPTSTGLDHYFLAAPRLPAARTLDPALQVLPDLAPGLTLGWLRGALADGRLPAPPALSPAVVSTYTLLVIAEQVAPDQGSVADCRHITQPTLVTVSTPRAVTVINGSATVRLVWEGTASSPARWLSAAYAPNVHRLLFAPVSLLVEPDNPTGAFDICLGVGT